MEGRNLHQSDSAPLSPSDPSHKPSYLKLSCAVSGYGKYSYYSTYQSAAKRSPSVGQLHLRSELSSSTPNMLTSAQIPRSMSSSEHMTRSRLTGSQDRGSSLSHSPAIILNGHSSKYPTGDTHKDGEYFLQTMKLEKDRISSLSWQAESDLKSLSLPEEACGKIRSAIGKANLLTSQKFIQFGDLCQNHMQPNPSERETKWEDLQGFWDMVKIQIENVDDMFLEIELMKQNSWQEVPKLPFSRRSSASSSPQSGNISQNSTPAATPSHTPGSRRKNLTPTISKDTPESSPERTQAARQAAKARDEARKKMLLEKRAAMKQAASATTINPETEVEIFLLEPAVKPK